ncbi:CLUMA_CG016783, isoform A [Clunio marinus]|uniref:CLUMA_CG016783, isoform A n=1 Tax=Clunio marinus TaxID=568069 RepID=A0A1J1IUI3_9DIPT|nr:CLUMA_CG016783, isoform A [Clunio marinus]
MRSKLNIFINLHKSHAIYVYMWLELCIWSFMSYSAVYYGKIFDYKNFQTSEFTRHINEGGNWYYRLMFGNMNLTNIDFDLQRNVQGKALN